MKPLAHHMASYGAYHRDPRNRATHFIGVPMIMFALLIALSWPRVEIAGFMISAAFIFVAAVLAYYLVLDFAIGVAMALFSMALLHGADAVARLPFKFSLTVFGITFAAGWVIQLIGH